ncbi:MAG: hypothetical protein ACYC7D_02580 [Nitrososphaerales archaeon]
MPLYIFSSNDRFLLIGDLHVNSAQFAVACEESGADAVLLHLNQDAHGGARFGGWEIEEQSIKDTFSVLKIPAGISIGDNRIMMASDWEAVVNVGFSFVNMFAHQLPTFVWDDTRISKVVSIGPGYLFEQVRAIADFQSTSGIIASLTPNQLVGLPLTLLDLTTLGLITKLSQKPVLMPTQRQIRPEDIDTLRSQGCRGIIVSNVVYGESSEGCRDQMGLFRKQIPV